MKANYKRKSLFILLNLKIIHLKRGDKSQWEQNSSAFSDNLLIQHLSSKQQDYPVFVVTATKTILKAFYGLKHLSQLHHKLWPSPHYLYTLVSFIFIFAYICLCLFFTSNNCIHQYSHLILPSVLLKTNIPRVLQNVLSSKSKTLES